MNQRRRSTDQGVASRLHTPTVSLTVVITLVLAITSGVVTFTKVWAKTDKNEENINEIKALMTEVRLDIKELLKRGQ